MRNKFNSLLLNIPKGKVTTYGELARILNSSPRGVGKMLNSNKDPDKYPCYKVVMKDCSIGGFALGIEEKIKRLNKDNIEVIKGKVEKKYIHYFK